jgi:iron complex outermembrane recepter protein
MEGPTPQAAPHDGTAGCRFLWRTAPARIAVLACLGLAWGQAAAFAADQKLRDLTELTPEQLANIEVTSVAKKPEKRSRTPAAVYVITRDHIRRSGVTTLVDALRLAPGIQVARIDSNKWAVGIRGFASSLTRSVLVMIDGRTVYTPLFAGTYWEVQDTLLEDVDRIEVIRGPGGSLWGANAVNGVINIITRSSRDTQGAFVKAGGGTMERGLAGIRYGGTAGEGFTYRAYAKGFDRGPGFHATTSDYDDWRMARAGFRTDWERTSGDTVRVQGDIYRGDAGLRTTISRLSAPFQETVETDTRLSGGNLLAHWQHRSSNGAEWSLLSYYDRTYRREPTFSEGRDTGDLDLQRQAVYGRHDLVLGLGYRVSPGTARSASAIVFSPPHRTDHLWTAFFRDELTFAEGRFVLALGSKLERNGYSGFEVQPNLQVLWSPSDRQSFWAAASRAVRTPSRVEHDLTITSVIDPRTPTFIQLTGNRQFRPEKIITVQVGHRTQVGRRVSLDTVLFHNTHRDLLSLEAGSPVRESSPPPARVVIPFRLGNGVQGSSYGLEVSSDWNPVAWWQIGGSYSFLRLDLENRSGSLDVSSAASTNGSSPRHMASILSQVKLGSNAVLDIVGRHVGALPARRIPAYTTVDARLGWRPVTAIELAVVGQNLLDRHHPEFPGGGGETVEVRRGVYGTVTWTP